MKTLKIVFVVLILYFFSMTAFALSEMYGDKLCHANPQKFDCFKTHRGDSWEKLFPNENDRDMVKRVNRIGVHLHSGIVIAVPRDLSSADIMDFSPLPQQISAPGERIVMVTLHNMAWGAYDESGRLVRWGPASSARGYCPDIHHGCHTPTGHFAVYNMEGPGCVSTKFPVGRGGAPMPWCMYFHGGFALHGSYEVPGYNASHGCVRLFVEDAKWLNQEFVSIGTPVIVRP